MTLLDVEEKIKRKTSYCLNCKKFVPHDHASGSRYRVKSFFPSHKVVEIDNSQILAVIDELKKELQAAIRSFPVYPDDVGGTYPYEIQMYAADVKKALTKLKEILGDA